MEYGWSMDGWMLGEFSEGNEKMDDLTEKFNIGLNTLEFC